MLCCDVATHEGYIHNLYNLDLSDQSLLTEKIRTRYEASFWLSVALFMSKVIDAIYKAIKLCIAQWKNIIYIAGGDINIFWIASFPDPVGILE
jgi:hypothetical protein